MRWPIALALVLLLAGAGLATLLVASEEEPITFQSVNPGMRDATASEWPEDQSACMLRTGDIHITEHMHQEGNIVLVSLEGDIWVDAVISTADGADGITPTVYPPEPNIPHYYHLGDSGTDGGDIVLFAPQGTIHVQATIRTGDGGNGLPGVVKFQDDYEKQDALDAVGDQHVFVYGGYGGFGGNIYFGAQDVRYETEFIHPGNGGRGGDAILDGATIHDEARGGHGGFGGQAYLLHQPVAQDLANRTHLTHEFTPSGTFSGCEHPVTVQPDERLDAQVIAAPPRTCRGGDGGDAWTYGLYASGPKYGYDSGIAGTAIGGNGGWGCPGGNGGNAHTMGRDGVFGRGGADGQCNTLSADGEAGQRGQAGGLGGHAFGGDGGAGLPGQLLTNWDGPNPIMWFYHWGPSKKAEYENGPDFPTSWDHEDGHVDISSASFPLIGNGDRFYGGDGGEATSAGGNGGRGGDGGAGSNGPVTGQGGLGGAGGRGAVATITMGGWGAPGFQGAGLPGTHWFADGRNGDQGDAGKDGVTGLSC